MLQAMNFYFFLPIALGVSVVLQASLNKEIALQYGLISTVLLNAAVLFVLSAIFYGIAKTSPDLFPDFFQPKSSTQSLRLLDLVPGICGFFIVLGLPWSLARLGPSNTFLLFIAVQIVLSLLIEAYSNQSLPQGIKLAGALLILAGGALVVKS